MKKVNEAVALLKLLFSISCLFLFGNTLQAQQLKITDFVIFSGPTGSGTSLIGSSITINNGSVGARNLVQTTGNATINANIHSGDKVIITNSNVVNGKITAANSSGSTGTILSVGSSTNISGNIDVNGNIVIGGGTVSGIVTIPVGKTYNGPAPGGGVINASPSLPTLPAMPTERTFDPAGAGTVTSSQTYTPLQSPFGNIVFSGNKTLTLKGPGVYVFNSLTWTGNSNKLILDFDNKPGKYYIYIHGNADFGKLNASITNGGTADRVYLETHGNGTGTSIPGNSFIISNGSSGGGSKWNGTVYASRSGVNIGSGTGSSTLTGAFYSATGVTLQSGVTINYSPFEFCTPITANAGTDQVGASTCGLTQVTLAANNPSPASGLWTIVSGTGGSFGNASSFNSTFTGVAGNTYTLRWTITNAPCADSFDDVTITFNQNPTSANAGADQINSATCGLTSVTLAANTPLMGTGSWSIVSGNGGSFVNANDPATDFNGNSGTTYNLRWTITNSPCTASADNMVVTFNPNPANVNAGPDKVLEFTGTSKLKGNTSATSPVINWSAINGGIIISNTSLEEITVSSAGRYIFSVSNAAGCTINDSVDVTSRLRTIKGSELQSVYENYDSTNFPGRDSVFFDFKRTVNPYITDYITIDVICKVDTQTVINLLTQPEYGMINILPNGLSRRTVTGDFPILNLPKLDSLSAILSFARPYYRPVTNAGIIQSQGDTTIRTHLVRKGYDVDGTGIKIGVISDSYNTILSGTTATPPFQPVTVPANPIPQTFNTNTAAQDLANGDLSNVKVLLDFPVTRSDEGRAMMQIINDVAPGAQKYFHTGFFTAGYFAKAIEVLKDSGCVIITDDITYVTEPMLKDGIVAKTVNKVKDMGVSYFSAAGNFANRSYEKDFNPIDASTIGFAPGIKAHDFGSGDMFQKLRLAPGSYSFVFQWVDDIYSAEESAGTQYDLDAYLTKETNGSGLIGYNRDNTFGDPIEFIPITIPPGDSVDYNLLIVNHNITGNPQRIKYVVFRGGIRFMEFNEGTSTIVGQSNARGAIAVGAARFNHVPGHPLLPASLAGITKPQIEGFSSVGGTYVTDAGGVQTQRLKPDLVASDGGNTTVKMGQDYPNEALDGWSNFFGTSAAAPHAAAAAALLMQGRKKFLDHHPETTSPDTIKAMLQATAVDMRPVGLIGYDFSSGAGLIDADSAMRTIASPVPFQINLVPPEDTIPGTDSFMLKITGQNFSNNTVVYLIFSIDTVINGIDTVVKDTITYYPRVITKNELWVKIGPFEGNPEIVAYTPPKTDNNDGGSSNTLYFFDAEIEVKAVSISKKYGEAMPALDTIITINGIELKDTSLTLADIGLASLMVQSEASTYSNVGTYVINVTREFDPNNPADKEFLKKYNYSFTNGTVTVNKMPVKVVPDNITVKYGQPINNISYKYYDGNNNLITNTAILNKLDSSHKKYKANNSLVVINDYPGSPAITESDIAEMSGMVSLQALINSRKLKEFNGSWVPAVPADSNRIDLQYIVDVSAESFRNYLNNPAQSELEPSYPGINSRAILGASKLLSGNAKIQLNGLVPLVNGELVPVVNTGSSTFVPLVNGELMQIVNGAPMQLVNGELVPVVNGQLVQVVNGVWVQVVNGQLVPVVNGDLVQVVNGDLMKVVNGQFVPLVNTDLVKLVNTAGGQSLVQMVNGELVQVVNGDLVPVVNGELVQVVNGELVKVVNSQLVPVVNGELMKLVNGELMKLVNTDLVHMVNSTPVPIANSAFLVQVVNGELVQVVNGDLYPLVNGLYPLVNQAGDLVPIVNSYSADANSNEHAVVIVDSTDATLHNGVLSGLFSANIITGLGVGQQKLISGALFNNNFDVTYSLGTVTINKDTITVKADSITRQFGNSNPTLTYKLSGYKYGETLATSDISGTPQLSTTAVASSPAGTYPITVSNGSLGSNNYAFKFVNGILTVTNNPCLLTHSQFKNFGNTTLVPTSLWLNMTTKVSGQLSSQGDYLLFRAGSVTFNSISSTPLVNNLPIPDGKIMADAGVTTPITSYDSLNNIWITKVPIGFSSTSDIFFTGAKINSSNGFIKQGGNSSSTLKGMFYSNKHFADQWAYAIAAYQPQFYYAAISQPGQVVSINGNYRAGTPIPLIPYIVNGGSGGGTNYTGSSSSFDNYTACLQTAGRTMQTPVPEIITIVEENKKVSEPAKAVQPTSFVSISPNPATDKILISFAPAFTENARLEIYSINGIRLINNELGICKKGVRYNREINVNNLNNGIYLVRIVSGQQITTRKIVIAR